MHPCPVIVISARPLANAAAISGLKSSGEPVLRDPMTGTPGGCARAARDHITAAHPRSVMNSRRCMCLPDQMPGAIFEL
jgi:hypothetical protein